MPVPSVVVTRIQPANAINDASKPIKPHKPSCVLFVKACYGAKGTPPYQTALFINKTMPLVLKIRHQMLFYTLMFRPQYLWRQSLLVLSQSTQRNLELDPLFTNNAHLSSYKEDAYIPQFNLMRLICGSHKSSYPIEFDVLHRLHTYRSFFLHTPATHVIVYRQSVSTPSDNWVRVNNKLLWLMSFRRLDPRLEIHRIFRDRQEYRQHATGAGAHCPHAQGAFTVWRPTSQMAISLLMTGKAIGKGLNIKGKSAKCGVLTGYVPFLQISKQQHKRKISLSPKNARIFLYFMDEASRCIALHRLRSVLNEMLTAIAKSLERLSTRETDQQYIESLTIVSTWAMTEPTIELIQDLSPANRSAFGLNLPERLFWETYVTRQDIAEDAWDVPAVLVDGFGRTGWETGRESEPAYMDMNLYATRRYDTEMDPGRTVLWQFDPQQVFNPRSLLMAYETPGGILPVASDFDCLLIGTKQVDFATEVPIEQTTASEWCLRQIEQILANPDDSKGWNNRWLDVLKTEVRACELHVNTPKYGFGDPLSYELITRAIEQSKQKSGAIRHGPECFNYLFPQELDDSFLVVWGHQTRFVDCQPFFYVNQTQLQSFLLLMISHGFIFPLNPKWIVADPGWYDIFNAMRKRGQKKTTDGADVCNPSIERALRAWYPSHRGRFNLIEEMDRIHSTYPMGFLPPKKAASTLTNTEQIDDMQLVTYERDRYATLRRAKHKLMCVIRWLAFTNMETSLCTHHKHKACIDVLAASRTELFGAVN
jgi:hypothetical protein